MGYPEFMLKMRHARVAMMLWDAYKDDVFTHGDVQRVTGKKSSATIRSLKQCGVLEPINRQSPIRRYDEIMPTQWRFTQRFVQYVNSPGGQEEYEIYRGTC